MQKHLVMILWAMLLSLMGFSQSPLVPAAYNGDRSRTIDLRDPSAGSLQKPLEYDNDKFKSRTAVGTVIPKERSCKTIEVEQDLSTKHAEATESPEEFEKWMQETRKRTQRSRSLFRNGNVKEYSIPVVVHVIYSNATENISDEQIYSQLEVLNQDYRRTNPDKDLTDREFRNLAVDTGIEFCLASVDPNGNSTNGIDRISLSGSPFSEQTINEQIKPSTIWDPNRYFNIWVINIAEGVLGFAQFPMSSGLTGIPNLPATAQTDGVVINYFAFGTIGTVAEPFNRGRTATHEIGHWLGLRHVWGDGPCGVDDYCGDTPETVEANFGCPSSVIGCDGERAMVQNFMEYTNDACMNLFTRDQRTRMRTVLENSPRRKSLLNSNACEEVVEPPSADFVADIQSGCGPLRVQFKNLSTGKPEKYAWTFTGGRPERSSDANPSVRFSKPGMYPVTLKVSNAGGEDTETKSGYIQVRANGLPLPYSEDFETGEPLVNSGNQLHNPQKDHTWSMTERVSAFGQGAKAITINNFDNNLTGSADWFLTPILDLTQEAQPVLSFKVAYSLFSPKYSDTLGVFIATECNTQFHSIYYRGGQQLSTTDPLNRPFSPRTQEWRTELIDLSEYRNSSHVQIAFVNFNGHGNDLFLDDIYIGKKPAAMPIADFDIDQTNVCAGDQIAFNDRSKNQPEQWIWAFEGGIPASDTTRNPVVRYPEPGLYDVKLTVRAPGGAHTETRESVIFVKPRPDLILEASETDVCAGQEIELAVRGEDSLRLEWSLGQGAPLPMGRTITLAPQENTQYSVTGTNNDGCMSTASLAINVREGNTLDVTPPAANICEGRTVRLAASGADNYTWSPGTGLNRTSGTTVQASPSRTTTYTVTGRTRSGCELTKEVTITVDAAPDLTIVADRESICPGVRAKLQAKGAATYNWSPAEGLNTVYGDVVMAAPRFTTTYTVSAATASGCKVSTKKTIEVASLPRISVSSDQAEICEGENVELQARGGVRYHWSPEADLTQTRGAVITARPKASTRFTVTGWNEAGCTDTTSILVGVLPKPTVEIEVSSPSVCRGESSSLFASSPTATRFQWRPRAGLDVANRDLVYASPRKQTTYTVSIEDEYGCRNQASTVISLSNNQRPKAAFRAEQTTTCLGQEVQFYSESEHAVEFLWEFPGGEPAFSREPNPKVRFIDMGRQDVSLTVFGCNGGRDDTQAKGYITVSTPFELNLNTEGESLCKGQSIELRASGAEIYEWAPAAGLDQTAGSFVIARPTTTTTYTVTATDVDGCKTTREIILDVVGGGGELTVKPFAPSICQGESVTLSVEGAASYEWLERRGRGRGVGSTLSITPKENTTYVVEGTTLDGCLLKDSVDITVRQKPDLRVSPGVANVCPGDQIALTLNRKGLYRWTPSVGLSASSGTEVVAFPDKTTTYTVSGTDENGCSSETSITVEVGSGSPLSVSAQDSIICLGESTLLSAKGGSGYQWFPADGLDKTSGPLISARPEKTTTYTVSTAEGGCGNERSVTIVVRPPQAIAINPPAPVLCEGETITLVATGGNERTYVWDKSPELNTIAGSRVTVSPTVTRSYKVRTLDEHYCEMEGHVTVEVAPSNFVEVTASNSSVCENSSISLVASGADSYEWLPGDGIVVRATARTSARPKTSSVYRVVGKNKAGCRDTAEVRVEVGGLDAKFEMSTNRIDLARTPGSVRFTDLTKGATSWRWNFANGSTSRERNPLHIFREPGTYQITLEVSNGICTTRVAQQLTVVNSSSVDELDTEGVIRVTERTTDGIILVEMDLPRAMTLDMQLLDSRNQQLAAGQLRLGAGPYRQQLSLAAHPKGTYQFKLKDANEKERVWRIVYGG